MIRTRISTWKVILLWVAIVVIACVISVRYSLEMVAATNDPEVYVHDPAFQVLAFFWVFGLPLLVLLGLLIFAARKLAKSGEISDRIESE